MSNIIDHPPHYEACRVTVEPIDVCEACLHGHAIGSHCAQGAQLALALGCDLCIFHMHHCIVQFRIKFHAECFNRLDIRIF